MFSFFILSCGQTSPSKTEQKIEEETKAVYEVKQHDYDSLTIPLFFKKLFENHKSITNCNPNPSSLFSCKLEIPTPNNRTALVGN